MSTQLPQEYTFFIEDAEQDPVYLNRWHFKFPNEWKTSMHSEPMIGVRRIYIPKAYRRIKFTINILPYDSEQSLAEIIVIPIECNIDVDEDIRKIRNTILNAVNKYVDEHPSTLISADPCTIVLDISYRKYDNRLSYVQSFSVRRPKEGNYSFMLKLTDMSDDFKAIMNIDDSVTETDFAEEHCFYDVWDRHDNIMSASFCSLNRKQYLGIDGYEFNPIKYYKLNTNTNSFWIELWNSRNKNVANILPRDKKEGLIIECVLLGSGKEIID